MKKFSHEELELMSYTDIAYEIIKDLKKPKNTMEIFKKVCDLLKLDDNQLNALIADFFSSMTTDKRFLLLEEGTWDLRERHASSKVKKGMDLEDDDEEEEEESEEDENLDDEEEIEEDEYDSLDEPNDDDDFEDDDLDDLVVVDEKELGMDE